MAAPQTVLPYMSVYLVDQTGQPVSVTSNALNTTSSGGGGSVTQGTIPWVVSGQGTAGTAATGVVTVQGIASMTKLLVTPDSVALPANQSVNINQINSVTPLMGNGVSGTGALRVAVASDSTGQVALAARTAGGGTTMYHAIVANNVTGVVVKNAAGAVYGITLSNITAVGGVLHLYNVASAPTAGAGTIVKALVAPGPSGGGGGGYVYSFPLGIPFSTGISYTFTTGISDTDTGVPAAGAASIDIDYI